jgi:hypothetical protein
MGDRPSFIRNDNSVPWDGKLCHPWDADAAWRMLLGMGTRQFPTPLQMFVGRLEVGSVLVKGFFPGNDNWGTSSREVE